MKRRKFILSIIGSAATVGWVGWKVAPKGFKKGTPLAKVTRTSWALGTQVSLTVFHGDERAASKAIELAFSELDKVESIMSLYRPESQICELNRTGKLTDAHPYLQEVLATAQGLSAKTQGAFDITVQPLYSLHSQSATTGIIPSQQAIETVLQRVGWQRVHVSGSTVELSGKGTEITLNGIAQGFAADRVAMILKENGIEHALIDTGEVGTIGNHAEKDNWTIGLKHPRKENTLMGTAALQGRCLATSGDYETRFGEGYRHHHILDPHTGQSPGELSSVSVAASTALEADALSTAVFLLGLSAGMRLVENTTGADAFFVTKDGRTASTSGFPYIS